MSAPQILETMRKELDQLLDALIRDFQHLRFGPIKPRQLFPVLLYGTILEFFDGCVHLLESRSHASLPVVLRSLIEAYIHLINVIDDPQYWQRMLARSLHEDVRILRYVRDNPQSEFHQLIAEAPELPDVLKKREQELKALEVKGVKKIDQFEAAKLAKLTDVYKSVYARL